MKLGVLTNLLADVPFAEAAKYFASLGIQAVEIGCGGYPGKAHADPDVLLNDEKALNDFRDVLKKNDLMISAFTSKCKSTSFSPFPPMKRLPPDK